MRSNHLLGLQSIRAAIASLCAFATVAFVFDANGTQAAPADAQHPLPTDWKTIVHDKLGFQIDYPGNVFLPAPGSAPQAGRLLVSNDGRAKLLIGAIDNDDQISLDDYRQHVLETSYAGSAIDYAPVRRSWFVLSGTREDTVFYERVSFTCGGRRITSWAMLYPHAERQYYNAIVESIARTFRPSRIAEESC